MREREGMDGTRQNVWIMPLKIEFCPQRKREIDGQWVFLAVKLVQLRATKKNMFN